MSRLKFTAKIRTIIADRAGHECSYPTCNRRTTGTGASSKEISGNGIAAHIFSAAEGGPRGQADLTKEEIISPENGIWLCSNHAMIVDNNVGVQYSPETLFSYKTLQEARIQQEVQGLYSSKGWIHKIKITNSPLFKNNESAILAKLNLFYGNIGTGKTALTEWISGIFNPSKLGRWKTPFNTNIDLTISYLDPKLRNIRLVVNPHGKIIYFIDGKRVPFNSIAMKIIKLDLGESSTNEDDRNYIASALDFDSSLIDGLIDNIHSFQHSHIRNLKFVIEDGQEYLHLDLNGTAPGLTLHALSTREIERVFIEFATAAARVSGEDCPTLLILDHISIIFRGWFDYYSHHLRDPSNQFQTLMCLPTQDLDLNNIKLLGWEVIKLSSGDNANTISQSFREFNIS